MSRPDPDEGEPEMDIAKPSLGSDGPADGDDTAPEAGEPVGFKKPPKQHQFKPGQSGNPKGRPKGAPGLHKILQKEFSQRHEFREGSRKVKLSKLQFIVKKALEKAMAGDQRAIEHVLSLNMQMFGLGKEAAKEEELTLGEQLYLDAIMRGERPMSDEEAGRDADPNFHNQGGNDDDES